MKGLHCRDVGSRWFTLSGYWNCDFIARGKSNDEILKNESEHAKAVHSMTIPASVAKEAEALIHDETSGAHRKSMSTQ
jgi:predicted small metal-binding protein